MEVHRARYSSEEVREEDRKTIAKLLNKRQREERLKGIEFIPEPAPEEEVVVDLEPEKGPQ